MNEGRGSQDRLVADIPPGHDAWVVGDVPVVAIDAGGIMHAKAS